MGSVTRIVPSDRGRHQKTSNTPRQLPVIRETLPETTAKPGPLPKVLDTACESGAAWALTRVVASADELYTLEVGAGPRGGRRDLVSSIDRDSRAGLDERRLCCA